jgi:hypothetical protein
MTPILTPEQTLDLFKTFVAMVAATASIMTFQLAKRIYKNQDAQKVFIKMRIEEILKFMADLEKEQLMIYSSIDGNTTVEFCTIGGIERFYHNEKRFPHLFTTAPLYFTMDVYNNLAFFKYAKNFLIPDEIKDDIEKLNNSSASTTIRENLGNHVFITNGANLLKESQTEIKIGVQMQNQYCERFPSFMLQVIAIKWGATNYLRRYGIK